MTYGNNFCKLLKIDQQINQKYKIFFFANPHSLLPINIVSLPLFWHKFTRGLQVSLLCLLMLYFVHEKSLCGSIALFLGKARSFQLNKSQTMRLKPLRKMQRNPSKDLPWFNKMRSWNNSPFRSKVLFTHYPISFIRFRLVWGRRLWSPKNRRILITIIIFRAG